jgi:hypothetical protein
MKQITLTIAALLACTAFFAIPAPGDDAPALAQAAAQSTPEIDALINQLGQDDYHIRLDAATRLKAIGQVAVPAVKKALSSQDPEVHARAEEILDDIEHPQVLLPQPTGFGSQIRISVINGAKVIDVLEPGRTIHIEQGPAGIRMKVAGKLDGMHVIREFNTRTAEQLRQENPDAFALFQQYAANGNAIRFGFQGNGLRIHANANVRVNGIFIGPGGAVHPVMPQPLLPIAPAQVNPGGDNLDGLELKIAGQMKARNLPEAEQEDVKGLLKQLREGAVLNNAEPDARIRDYDRHCDALRKKLADLNLADPGDALPPPASRRLGISVAPEMIPGQGLVITHVQAGSRAARLGLKEQDSVLKVNNKEIRTIAELRKIVTDNAGGLVVKGVRDGQPFEWHEMGDAPQPPKL